MFLRNYSYNSYVIFSLPLTIPLLSLSLPLLLPLTRRNNILMCNDLKDAQCSESYETNNFPFFYFLRYLFSEEWSILYSKYLEN